MCYYNKSHFEHKIININKLNDIEYLKKENITIEEEKNDLEYHIKLINKLKNIIENMNSIYNINNNTFINNVFHNSKNNINNDNNIQKDLSDDKILANHTLINPDRNDNTNNTKN